MHKNLVRRSQLILVAITTATQYNIEADEAYITQVTPSTVLAKVQRQREKDLAGFLTANPAVTGGAIHVWGTLDSTYGRVPLDAPLDTTGKLTNKLVTTTAGDYTQGDRERNHSLAMKETITVAPVTDGSLTRCIIELVHYVPANEIAA